MLLRPSHNAGSVTVLPQPHVPEDRSPASPIRAWTRRVVLIRRRSERSIGRASTNTLGDQFVIAEQAAKLGGLSVTIGALDPVDSAVSKPEVTSARWIEHIDRG